MKVFHLTQTDLVRADLRIFILTPDDVTDARVAAAWAYAMQYSAKGLLLPDFDAAKALLMQRHPSWQFASGFSTIKLNLELSEQDETEA